MSHSTYVGKTASPAIESSWHLPLPAFPTIASVPRVTAASRLQRGRFDSRANCVNAYQSFTCTHLKRAWVLQARLTSLQAHNPWVHTHQYSPRIWFRPWLKCQACTLLHCSQVRGICSVIMKHLTWLHDPQSFAPFVLPLYQLRSKHEYNHIQRLHW